MPPRLLLILTENWTMRPVPEVADLVRWAAEAERAGIDGVMVSEHIVLGPSANAGGLPANPRDYALPGNQDPATPWPSPLVLLSAIAAATTKIRLVAGAIISPLRHPLALAKDLATLDRLSGGRLIVLPTVSWHRDEYEALGVPFSRRGDILDEQLEIWSLAWSGGPFSFSGNHYSFGKVWIEPQPARRGGPALWFGGSSVHPRLLRRLARYGSGFNPLGSPSGGELELLAAAGCGPDRIEYVGGVRGVFDGPDGVADLDRALATIPGQLERGFGTICVKPSQFIDDAGQVGDFCADLVARAAALGRALRRCVTTPAHQRGCVASGLPLLHRGTDESGVRVLLEAHHLAVCELPMMDETGTHMLACRLEGTRVGAERDDLIPVGQVHLRIGPVAFPVLAQAVEHVGLHRLRADEGAGVGEAGHLRPPDIGRERRQHSLDVAAIGRGVVFLDRLQGRWHRVLLLGLMSRLSCLGADPGCLPVLCCCRGKNCRGASLRRVSRSRYISAYNAVGAARVMSCR